MRRFTPSCGYDPDGAPQRSAGAEPLQFDNGYGGFSADGREYVIRFQPDGRRSSSRPPAAVGECHCQRAGRVSRDRKRRRLHMVRQQSRQSAHGLAQRSRVRSARRSVWIRDEDAGVFWSPTPGPTPAAAEYLVRHGFGYTTFEHESHELSQEVTMFMARDEPVKITRLRLVNRSGRTRRLSLFSYLQWALGDRGRDVERGHDTLRCRSARDLGDESRIASTMASALRFPRSAWTTIRPCATSRSRATGPLSWAATAILTLRRPSSRR